MLQGSIMIIMCIRVSQCIPHSPLWPLVQSCTTWTFKKWLTLQKKLNENTVLSNVWACVTFHSKDSIHVPVMLLSYSTIPTNMFTFSKFHHLIFRAVGVANLASNTDFELQTRGCRHLPSWLCWLGSLAYWYDDWSSSWLPKVYFSQSPGKQVS